MKVAVIPARGGSKRIPRKNIKDFCGKPMIAWSIEAALRSECFDDIVVSTDDEEIAEVARRYGASVPFMRPKELADDYTGTTAVVAHALTALEGTGTAVDLACCIYATAPLLQTRYILEGLTALNDRQELLYAFSGTAYSFPIQRALRVHSTDHTVSMFNSEHMNTRSQDLEPAFHDAGQFYWGRNRAWLTQTAIYSSSSAMVQIPHYLVQDIDTPEDWTRAEMLFTALMQGGVSEEERLNGS